MFKKIFQYSVVFLLCVFSAEATLRVYNYFSPSFIFYNDSYNRFRGKPGDQLFGFTLNKLGFMDTEFSVEKNNKFRVLAIGDSFTFGIVPYQDNFVTLIEDGLVTNHPNVEIYNMGITSTGPREYYSLLLSEGLQFKPDMVMLSFYIGNDFIEADRKEFYEETYITSLIYYVAKLRPQFSGRDFNRGGDFCDDCSTMSEEQYLKTQKNKTIIFKKDSVRFIDLQQHVFVNLKEIKRLCDKQNIKLLVNLIPSELQLNAPLREKLKIKYQQQDEEWDLDLPNQVLKKMFADLNIEYLDLTPAFSSEDPQRMFYKPNDSHWNRVGNKLAADIITPVLETYIP